MTDTFSVKRMWREARGNPEDTTKRYFLDKVTRLATNVYNVEIDGVDTSQLENFLFLDKMAILWNSKELGMVITKASVIGQDYNGIPNKFRPQFSDSMNAMLERPELTIEECVPFYDCSLWYLGRRDCLYMANDYADATETIRTQVFNQKTPMLAIAGTDSIKKKLKDLYVKIADNAKAIFIDSDLGMDKLQPLDFNAPFNIELLQSYKKCIENEALEYCGIDSQDAFHKKERMIVDEQEGNDELLNYMLADGFKARQRACDKVIEIFGLTATVEIQDIVRPIEDEVNYEDDNSGEDNGNYNNQA